MFNLGLLSIIQAVFLPGFIACLLIKDIRWIDRILMALPLSLVINYTGILLLVLCGSYTRNVLVIVVIVEIVLLAILFFKVRKSCNQCDIVLATPHFSKSINLQPEELFVSGIAFCFFGAYFYVAWQQATNVFIEWDAVVSWNKWAVDWFNGRLPHRTWTYPQGLPVLYSLTYQFMGGAQVQFFAKFIAIVFPIAAIATLARAALIIDGPMRNVALLSLPIFLWIQCQEQRLDFIFSGHADAPIAYFGVFAVYMYAILWQRSQQVDYKASEDRLVGVAVIAISGAALIKQTGFVSVFLFPLGYYYYFVRGVKFWKSRWFWLCAIFSSILVFHWYLYKAIQIYQGYDSTVLDVYSSLIPGHWLMRPLRGVVLIFDTIGWAWLPAFVVGLSQPLAKRLAICGILPLFLFWAFMASYCVRNLSIALPWISLILAAGCVKLYTFIQSDPKLALPVRIWLVILFVEMALKSLLIGLGWNRVLIPFILVCLFVMVAILAYKSAYVQAKANNSIRIFILVTLLATLLAIVGGALAHMSSKTITQQLTIESIEQQQKLGIPELNKYLLEYFAENPGGVRDVATTYQYLGYVPGLAEHYREVLCNDDQSFLEDPQVHYFLMTPYCDYTDAFVQRLDYHAKKIKEDNKYMFYKINH